MNTAAKIDWMFQKMIADQTATYSVSTAVLTTEDDTIERRVTYLDCTVKRLTIFADASNSGTIYIGHLTATIPITKSSQPIVLEMVNVSDLVWKGDGTAGQKLYLIG